MGSVLRAWVVIHGGAPAAIATAAVAVLGGLASNLMVPTVEEEVPFPVYFLMPPVLALIASTVLVPRQPMLGGSGRPAVQRLAAGGWTGVVLLVGVLAVVPMVLARPNTDLHLAVPLYLATTVAIAGLLPRLSWAVGAIGILTMPFIGAQISEERPVHDLLAMAPEFFPYVLIALLGVGWMWFVWRAPVRVARGRRD